MMKLSATSDHRGHIIRQALASPFPGFTHDPMWSFVFLEESIMRTHTARVVLAMMVAVSLSACATALRNPRISELQNNPGRYQDRSVNIDGVVTTSWSVPLAPFHFYKVDDGSGEVTVLSQGSRTPGRGAKVRVKGKVEDFAMLGGRSVGLHLREQSIDVKR